MLAQSSPVVTIRGDSVEVSDVIRGGSIALVGTGRGVGRRGMISQILETHLLVDQDADGVVSFKPKNGVPFRSVWVATEIDTGRFATGSPEGFAYRHLPLESSLKKDLEGELGLLERDVPRMVVLLVRPKSGAWVIAAREGSSFDRDGSNGRLQIAFEDTVAIAGKAKGPKHLKIGDLVVAIDPYRLELFSAEVSK